MDELDFIMEAVNEVLEQAINKLGVFTVATTLLDAVERAFRAGEISKEQAYWWVLTLYPEGDGDELPCH